MPNEPTAASTRLSIRAIQLGRRPRYSQRLKVRLFTERYLLTSPGPVMPEDSGAGTTGTTSGYVEWEIKSLRHPAPCASLSHHKRLPQPDQTLTRAIALVPLHHRIAKLALREGEMARADGGTFTSAGRGFQRIDGRFSPRYTGAAANAGMLPPLGATSRRGEDVEGGGSGALWQKRRTSLCPSAQSSTNAIASPPSSGAAAWVRSIRSPTCSTGGRTSMPSRS